MVKNSFTNTLVSNSKNTLAKYKDVNQKSSIGVIKNANLNMRSTAPPKDILKVIGMQQWIKSNCKVGIEVTIRDWKGQVQATVKDPRKMYVPGILFD